SARIARVAVVALLVELVARNLDLLRVHDDHEVASVDVRRVLRLVLAPQRVRDLRRETAERLPARVDDVPVARDFAGLGVVGLRAHAKGGRSRAAPGRDGSSYAASTTVADPGSRARIHAAGATARTAAPIASETTPRLSSATPPTSASEAPRSAPIRSLSPKRRPRSTARVRSASCAAAAT